MYEFLSAFPSPSPTILRMQLKSSNSAVPIIQAMQLVGVEILLHFLMGPAVTDLVKQNKIQLSLGMCPAWCHYILLSFGLLCFYVYQDKPVL